MFTSGLDSMSMVEEPNFILKRKFTFFSKRIIYNFIAFGIDNKEEMTHSVEGIVMVIKTTRIII